MWYTLTDYIDVSMQERGGASAEFTHENLMIKFKMDNEFELVYVVREKGKRSTTTLVTIS